MLIICILCFFIIRNYKRLLLSSNTLDNCCLLIAHPDDESMFFGPTLLNITGNIHIICLSKGDTLLKFDYKREHELKVLCEKYNWKLEMYSFLDNENWCPEKISNILMLNYLLNPFTTLITFDEKGVSGHKNHISCHKGGKIFSNKYNVKTMYLKSLNIFQKYVFNYQKSENEYILGFKDYFSVIKMMLFHKSQLLWFRYFYLMFSSYTSYNSY